GRLFEDRGADRMTAIVAASPARPTLVRAVCVREWREALSNKLLVGMTLLPPVVILATGVLAVAAAAINPPSEHDVQALYAAAPAAAGLDPKEAVQGFIATYFLILFMLIPTVVPLTALGIAQVTGRVVLDNGAFLQMSAFLIVVDVAVFWLAKVAFQRENILVRWR